MTGVRRHSLVIMNWMPNIIQLYPIVSNKTYFFIPNFDKSSIAFKSYSIIVEILVA